MKIKQSKRFLQLCGMLSGVMMFLLTGQAHAMLVDDFSTDQGPTVVSLDGNTLFDTVDGGGIIGGERDMAVTCISGCSAFDQIKSKAQNGAFSHSQDQGVTGKTILTWDGNDGDGSSLGYGLGADFTEGGTQTGLYYKIIDDDVDVNFTFRAYTNAGNWSELIVPHTGPITNTDFVALYSDFVTVAGTGVNFGNVGALELIVEASAPNLDLSLDFISTTGGQECIENCIPVETPEPGTWLLFGTGLIGIVGYGWRRNKVMA